MARNGSKISGPLFDCATQLRDDGYPVECLYRDDPTWDKLRSDLETRMGVRGGVRVDWSLFDAAPEIFGPDDVTPYQRASTMLSNWGKAQDANNTVWAVPFFGVDSDAVALEVTAKALSERSHDIASQGPLAVYCKTTTWCFVWRHETEMGMGHLSRPTATETG